jgi:hypothetical protein
MFMKKSKLFKSKKNIIFFISVLFSILLVIYFLYYPLYFGNIGEKNLAKEYNSETSIFSYDQNSPIIDGWEGVKQRNPNYEVVLTNNNPFSPIFSYVTDNGYSRGVGHLYLKRKSTFSMEFELVNYIAYRTEKPFDEAIEIARNYDLTKENPDPQNIKVIEPPTAEEIEARKQRDKEQEEFLNSDFYKEFTAKEAELQARVDRLPPQARQEYEIKSENGEFLEDLVLEDTSGMRSDQLRYMETLLVYENLEQWLDQNYPETRED